MISDAAYVLFYKLKDMPENYESLKVGSVIGDIHKFAQATKIYVHPKPKLEVTP